MDQIGSLAWVFSVVVVGVLVNLFSSFLWKYTPKALAKVSDRWAVRSEKARLERERQIESLMGDAEERLSARLWAIRQLSWGILLTVMAGTVLVFGTTGDFGQKTVWMQWVILGFVLVCLMLASISLLASTREQKLVGEARKRMREESQPPAEHDDD